MDFNTAFRPDQFHLSNLIRNHLSRGSPSEALVLYNRIRGKGTRLLELIPLILKVCGFIPNLDNGKALHGESMKAGVYPDVTVGSSLIKMYAKCGDIFSSIKVFEEMSDRNVVAWNAMIGGYMRSGDTESASVLFEAMPNRTTVTWIEMIKGFAKAGKTDKARELFNRVPLELKNVKTWTVMVEGCSSNGEMEAAREIFEKMPERNYFVWSSMVSGYCKKGDVNEARVIFDGIPVKNLVNWNSLISGYTQNGYPEEAIEAFYKMQAKGFEPDEVTISCALSACAQLGRLDVGKEIHLMMNHRAIELNMFILNALVDMYAKSGDLTSARLIFDSMNQRNTACWNSMISGLAIHGKGREALEYFSTMEDSDVKPDDITFLSVLSACVHGGFVDKGLEIFSKIENYSLKPNVKHYGCLVDLLGRAGRLKEAYSLIKAMPVKPNDTVFGALLGACRVHLDAKMAEKVMKEIGIVYNTMGCEEENHLVLVSNIYAISDCWEKAEMLRMAMVKKGLQKTLGCSQLC